MQLLSLELGEMFRDDCSPEMRDTSLIPWVLWVGTCAVLGEQSVLINCAVRAHGCVTRVTGAYGEAAAPVSVVGISFSQQGKVV